MRHFGISRQDGSNLKKNELFQLDAKLVDEEQLIRRTFELDAKQGCRILFQKYHQMLCSHAVRLVYSKQVAEDIVADLFCRFWSDRIYLHINTSYRAYLFKAVRHSAYNYIKWELSKNVKVERWDSYHDVANSSKPEEALHFEELTQEIEQIVEALPNQCKKVFVLSRFENKKYKDIALELGITVKAVEANISRALEALRKGLKNSGLIGIFLLSVLA